MTERQHIPTIAHADCLRRTNGEILFERLHRPARRSREGGAGLKTMAIRLVPMMQAVSGRPVAGPWTPMAFRGIDGMNDGIWPCREFLLIRKSRCTFVTGVVMRGCDRQAVGGRCADGLLRPRRHGKREAWNERYYANCNLDKTLKQR
jgi:hypothetical protein